MSQPSGLRKWEACGRVIVAADDAVPKVMGIVNLTPDSFSDGLKAWHPDDALAHARRLVAEGADLLDLGGESSRPGAVPVSLTEELRRVIPIVEAITASMTIPLSIDTTKAAVARQAIDLGALIINDISALQADEGMARVAADTGAGVVLMHMQGTPPTMQDDPHYEDVVIEVYDFLARRVEWAVAHGIPRERIAVDPGIGFGKRSKHNLDILQGMRRFENLGCVVLIGASKKGFLGKITGRPTHELVSATVACSLAACVDGAQVVRVHDVGPMVDTIKVWTALRGWGQSR